MSPGELDLAAQSRMVAALRRGLAPAGAPLAGTPLFETHLSWVLLADGCAYKLKKALDLGFADFTTRALRLRYCTEELRINRRLAPALYLDVVAVTGTVDAPRLGGDGPVLDHAVRMRAFDPALQWDRLAERGAITDAMIDALAESVAAFHMRLRAATDRADPRALRYGSAAHVHRIAQDNFDVLRSLLRDAGAPEALATLEALARREAHRHATLAADIDARAAVGFVCECHGDLHLGNIAQVDERPTVFDAIEFNEGFRWSDVLCEVAFLVMDLRHRGLDGQSARFLNGWLALTGDYAGLRLLPGYLEYRALVRAKVAGIRAAQLRAPRTDAQVGSPRHVDDPARADTATHADTATCVDTATHADTAACVADAARAAAEAQCRDYLALATRLAAPAHPRLVLMHGLSGSGKTRAAGLLAQAIGAIHLRSDVERKRLHGLRADDHGGAHGPMYGPAAGAATYDRLAVLARGILEAGFDAIVDATFLARAQRAGFVALARALAVPVAIVDLRASPHTLRARVAERLAHGRDASDADLDVLERQFERDEPVLVSEADRVLRVDSDRHIDAAALAPIAAALSGMIEP